MFHSQKDKEKLFNQHWSLSNIVKPETLRHEPDKLCDELQPKNVANFIGIHRHVLHSKEGHLQNGPKRQKQQLQQQQQFDQELSELQAGGETIGDSEQHQHRHHGRQLAPRSKHLPLVKRVEISVQEIASFTSSPWTNEKNLQVIGRHPIEVDVCYLIFN